MQNSMMGRSGIVFNIMRFSLNDGPGIRSTVFLKGCPLSCPWCHNPESIRWEQEVFLRDDRCIHCGECIDRCAHQAISDDDGRIVTDRTLCTRCGECTPHCFADAREIVGKEMTAQEVVAEVLRDRVFFDDSGGGVSFSGGEPFLQHEFLEAVLTACKQEALHTTVDTTGCTPPAVLERISPLVDLYLYDIKMMDDTKHRAYTGVSNGLILENLRRLVEWGNEVIVRIPLIPGINDDPENIRASGEFLATMPAIREVHVLPYHASGGEKYARLGKSYTLGSVKAPSRESVNRIIEHLQRHVPSVVLGG
jgi:pyruvate formate lyase activating enzyme